MDMKVTPRKRGKLTRKNQKKAIPITRTLSSQELDKAQTKKIFDLFDYNGNGGISLAEIDRAIFELYPHLAYNDADKTAVIKEAQKIAKKSKDNVINFKDFSYFIDYIHDYCEKAVDPTKKLDEAWVKKVFDYHSNEGVIPLAEVNKIIFSLYPHLKKDKSAIMQAYKDKIPKLSKDDFVNFKEFECIIDALHYYNKKAEFTIKKLSKNQVKKIFDVFDYNNDGTISRNETARAVVKLYPHFLKDNFVDSVIKHAFDDADASKDDVIDFNEFGRLIDLLHYYNELSSLFKRLDIDNNGCIDFEEFKKGHDLIGIDVKSEKLKETFDGICGNNKKHILFDEFCIYAAKIKLMSEDAQGVQKTLEAQESLEIRETPKALTRETREIQEVQETQPIISQKSYFLQISLY